MVARVCLDICQIFKDLESKEPTCWSLRCSGPEMFRSKSMGWLLRCCVVARVLCDC